ncbi:MAG: DUF484 family protein [Methylophilus sp.]|jgi:hypothetical protein
MMEDSINENDIKLYLKAHPDFFESHAHLLAELFLPSPHGKGTISLAERQQIAQRDKIRVLESRFTELILTAEENESTANKVHELTLGLLFAKDVPALHAHLVEFLASHFQLPGARLRLWENESHGADDIFIAAEDSLKNWAKDLSQPYCGTLPTMDIAGWFTESPASLAVIPMRYNEVTFGLLAIPSEQRSRFYAGMGTLFLNRIGELVSASLARYII